MTRISTGTVFHNLGPIVENALSPYDLFAGGGWIRVRRLVDLRVQNIEKCTSEQRYAGAILFTHLSGSDVKDCPIAQGNQKQSQGNQIFITKLVKMYRKCIKFAKI